MANAGCRSKGGGTRRLGQVVEEEMIEVQERDLLVERVDKAPIGLEAKPNGQA